MKNCFRFLSLLLLVSGCAFGPLVNHETGRTVGAGKFEMLGGYGNAGFVGKLNVGLSDNFDVGLHWETLSIGLRAKYAFIQPTIGNGFAFATALGAGSSIGGDHVYGDLVASYLVNWWEPYVTVRVVHVKTDPLDFKNKDTGDLSFTVSSSEYNYGQAFLGSRFWIGQHFMISAEVSSLFTLSRDFQIGSAIVFGGALGFRL